MKSAHDREEKLQRELAAAQASLNASRKSTIAEKASAADSHASIAQTTPDQPPAPEQQQKPVRSSPVPRIWQPSPRAAPSAAPFLTADPKQASKMAERETEIKSSRRQPSNANHFAVNFSHQKAEVLEALAQPDPANKAAQADHASVSTMPLASSKQTEAKASSGRGAKSGDAVESRGEKRDVYGQPRSYSPASNSPAARPPLQRQYTPVKLLDLAQLGPINGVSLVFCKIFDCTFAVFPPGLNPIMRSIVEEPGNHLPMPTESGHAIKATCYGWVKII